MMARVRAEAQAFALPKAGHTDAEYEDAHAGPSGDASGSVRLAVADGATESAFAGAWARALVAAWVAAPGDLLGHARAAFEAEVARRAETLPWYAQAKAEEGAFATFVGLSVAPNGTWRAEAVGDAVLFHLRESSLLRENRGSVSSPRGGVPTESGRRGYEECRVPPQSADADSPPEGAGASGRSASYDLIHVWPIIDPAEFGNVPALLGSRPGRSEPEWHRLGGTWQAGDAFVLTTDALAAYLLHTDPTVVLALDDADAFAAFIADARASGMRNDDVTLLRLRLR